MLEVLPAIAAAAIDRVDLWIGIARAVGARRLAEVGVWRGAFASRLLRSLPELDSCLLIDPWRPLEQWDKPLNVGREQFEAAMHEALEATAFAGPKVVVLRGTTAEVVDHIPDASLDLVYLDGDHTLRGIAIDLMRMIRKVRHGGLLGGDDYLADPWHHGVRYEPTLVCPFARYFAEAMQLPFVALPFGQFVIVNDPIGFSFTNLSGGTCRDRVGKPAGTAAAAVRGIRRRCHGVLGGFLRRSRLVRQRLEVRLSRNAWLQRRLMEWRSRRTPSLLVSRHATKIVIEGFPRSANSFSVRMFHAANPEIAPHQISHHSHSIENVKRAVGWGIPVAVVIRNPVDAIASTMIFMEDTSDAMCRLLAMKYIDFYGWIEGNRGSVVLLPFEDVTNGGFKRSCGLINERFGTGFRTTFDEAELARSVREAIMLGSPNREDHSRIPMPSRFRTAISVELRPRVAAHPVVHQALRLYDRLFAMRPDEPVIRVS